MKRNIPIVAATILLMFAAVGCAKAESAQSGTQTEALREEKKDKAQEVGREEAADESGHAKSEDALKEEEGEKSKALRLFYTEPLTSKLVWTQPSALTKVEKESWTDVLQFAPSEVGTISAYAAKGRYKVLKARVAPEEDWEDDDIARIIVYGDGDVVLYESPEITKDTKAFDMQADIGGLQAVSIKAVSIEGGSGHIILKDAVFE